MLGQISKLIKAFNSDIAPEQISLGIAFAMVAGLTPLWSLHNLLVLFLVCILRVNGAAFMAGLGLFAILAYLLDPLFHHLGLYLLRMDALSGLWVMMYNSTLWRIENFNNTIVMGSLVFSLVLFVPVYFGSIQIITRYRVHIKALIEKMKLDRFLKIQGLTAKVRSYIRWGQ